MAETLTLSNPGHRRCDDCRKAGKHPEPGLFDLKEA